MKIQITILLCALLLLPALFMHSAYAQTPTQDEEVMKLLKTGADYVYSNHFQEAIEPLTKALNAKSDPSRELAGHYLIALAYSGLNRNQEAIESFKKALAFKPDFSNALLGLGKAYLNTEKFEEAVETYKKVVAIDPKDPIGQFSLGVAYIRLKKFNEAAESLKQTVTIKPDFAEAHHYLGKRGDDRRPQEAAEVRVKPFPQGI